MSNLFTDLIAFSEAFLKIQDKQGNIIPLVLNPVQRMCLGQLGKRTLILKSRQLGMSTMLQAEIYRQLITKPTSALTLSHSDATTQLLRDIADRYHTHFPEFSDVQKIRRTQANARVTKFDEMNSRHVIGTAGSKAFGRGGSYTIIHGSETAFWENAEDIISGALQGGDPQVILETTPNGAQGWFYETAMEALAGRGGWKLLFYPWWLDSTYAIPTSETLDYDEDEQRLVAKHRLTASQIAWRRMKRAELKGKFIQEYPEDPVTCFLTSGNGYFADVLTADTFTAPGGATYQPGHVYTAGLDFGQSLDATYMGVFDRTANVQVDWLHVNKQPWKEIRRRIKNLSNKWHCSTVLAEANSIGSVNIEELRADAVPVEAWEATNDSKSRVMANLYDAIENGLRLLDWDVQRSEMYNFVSTQLPSGVWRLAAAGTGHDDTVVGNALAVAARLQPNRGRSLGRR